MQGFIYTLGVYNSVDKRVRENKERGLRTAWLRDSIKSIVNSFDGKYNEGQGFSGSSDAFNAVSVFPIASDISGYPHSVVWKLESKKGIVELLYAEKPVTGNKLVWYTIEQWSGISARWLYFYEGKWHQEFLQVDSFIGTDERNTTLLPKLIGLEITGSNKAQSEVFFVGGSGEQYFRPEVAGVQ